MNHHDRTDRNNLDAVSNYQKASIFGERALAFILDAIFLAIIQIIIGAIVVLIFRKGLIFEILNLIFQILAPLAYVYFTMIPTGQTPGKKMMKIRVVRFDGRPLSLKTLLLRELLGKMLSSLLLMIGYIMAFFDEKYGRALHDRLAKTMVVKA